MAGQGAHSHRAHTGETDEPDISDTDMSQEDKVGRVNGADGCSGGWSERPWKNWAMDNGLGSVLKDFSSITIKSQQTCLLFTLGCFNIGIFLSA